MYWINIFATQSRKISTNTFAQYYRIKELYDYAKHNSTIPINRLGAQPITRLHRYQNTIIHFGSVMNYRVILKQIIIPNIVPGIDNSEEPSLSLQSSFRYVSTQTTTSQIYTKTPTFCAV